MQNHNNKSTDWFILILLPGALAVLVAGCNALPARQATDAALVVHTSGSSQDMIAARVPTDAATVFDSFVRIIEKGPDIEVINRKNDAMLVEIVKDGLRITAQATQLGAGESLLYIWADAGDSGRTGSELATGAVESICEELGVPCERVDY